jgi:hypothetical protein
VTAAGRDDAQRWKQGGVDGMGLVGSTSKIEAQVEFVAGVEIKFWISIFCSWAYKWDLEVSIWRSLLELLYFLQLGLQTEGRSAERVISGVRPS